MVFSSGSGDPPLRADVLCKMPEGVTAEDQKLLVATTDYKCLVCKHHIRTGEFHSHPPASPTYIGNITNYYIRNSHGHIVKPRKSLRCNGCGLLLSEHV